MAPIDREHILICGERHAGKSTLIARLIRESGRPVYGFVTRTDKTGEDGYHAIYMHPAAQEEKDRVSLEENRIGRCDTVHHEIRREVFETLGVQLIRDARPDGILVMDELGFMEADCPAFTKAVLEALAGDIPVIAAVKLRYDVPFLNAVRASSKARVYPIDERSRDALYRYLRGSVPWLSQGPVMQ